MLADRVVGHLCAANFLFPNDQTGTDRQNNGHKDQTFG
jgi:hypothetical protein